MCLYHRVLPFNIALLLQEGAFALAFKSKHFPGELVVTRRGSPLLVGIKTKEKLASDHIPVLYSKGKDMKEEWAVFSLFIFTFLQIAVFNESIT